MSIFNIFRPNAQQPQQQGQPSTPASPHVENNPTVPNNTNTPPAPAPSPENPQGQSPTDGFKDLWKMEPNQQGQAPNFKLNPEHLQQTAGKLDFTKAVNRDDLQKIAGGGDEAIGALMNVLNTFGQAVFSTNAQFSSHLTEAGYKAASESIDRGLPNLVKKQFAQSDLFTKNSKLRDPALQPLVLAIQSQISDRHPNASPAEVNAMVEQYFNSTVATAFKKEDDKESQGSKASLPDDFSSFLA